MHQQPLGPPGAANRGPHPMTSPYPYPQRIENGAVAWILGVVCLVLIPFVMSIVAGLLMVIVGRSKAKQGPLAYANGNRAANWGLTYLLSTVLLVGAHLTVLFIVKHSTTFFPVGIPITIWAAHTLVHIVVSFVGYNIAGKGKVVPINGLPFFRST